MKRVKSIVQILFYLIFQIPIYFRNWLLSIGKLQFIAYKVWGVSDNVLHSNNFISYDTPDHRSAAAHGVFDSKLGATKDQECQTCKQNFKDCPGHFGYIPVSYQ